MRQLRKMILQEAATADDVSDLVLGEIQNQDLVSGITNVMRVIIRQLDLSPKEAWSLDLPGAIGRACEFAASMQLEGAEEENYPDLQFKKHSSIDLDIYDERE